MLRSGRDQYVEDDIRAVVEAAGGVPVKVILEAHYLTDEQIVRGSQLAVRAGAAFVKTGTGWAPTGATLHNVRLIKSADRRRGPDQSGRRRPRPCRPSSRCSAWASPASASAWLRPSRSWTNAPHWAESKCELPVIHGRHGRLTALAA